MQKTASGRNPARLRRALASILAFVLLAVPASSGLCLPPAVRENGSLARLPALKNIWTKPSCAMSPAFDEDILAYTVRVPAGTAFIRLCAAAGDRGAVIRINGKKTSGLRISLSNAARETASITVSKSGKQRRYRVTLVRAARIVSFTTNTDFLSTPVLYPAGRPLAFSYTLRGAAQVKIEVLSGGAWVRVYAKAKAATKGNFLWDGRAGGSELPPGTYKMRLRTEYRGSVSTRTRTVRILGEPPAYNVFLSPSMQEHNRGAGDYGTEEQRMNEVADVVQRELERCGLTVYRNRPDWTLKKAVAYANKKNCRAYVAIHSNAMGRSRDGGTASGCEVWTYKKGSWGERLAKAVYKKMEALTPVKDRGVKYASLYETRYPKAPSCLAEVDFHDNPARAEWIIEHIEPIGVEIARGICDYLNVSF